MGKQMYIGALVPNRIILNMKNIPKAERHSPYMWHDKEIIIFTWNTQKGIRSLLECPNCKKNRYQIFRYAPKHDDPIYCCRQCDPYYKTPYPDRVNLKDHIVNQLVEYHIRAQENKLKELGVQIDIYWGELQNCLYPPTMDELLSSHSRYFTPELFDYQAHLWQKPKHMHLITFKRMLVKLQLLYQLKNTGTQYQKCFTGTEISTYTTKEKIDEFIQKHETQ